MFLILVEFVKNWNIISKKAMRYYVYVVVAFNPVKHGNCKVKCYRDTVFLFVV